MCVKNTCINNLIKHNLAWNQGLILVISMVYKITGTLVLSIMSQYRLLGVNIALMLKSWSQSMIKKPNKIVMFCARKQHHAPNSGFLMHRRNANCMNQVVSQFPSWAEVKTKILRSITMLWFKIIYILCKKQILNVRTLIIFWLILELKIHKIALSNA